MKRCLIHSCLLLLCLLPGRAQDLAFTQFTEQHALLNPALTGATEPMRGVIGLRQQAAGSGNYIHTFGLSFETRANTSCWKEVDRFRSMTFKERTTGRLAWGASVFNIYTGAAGPLTTVGSAVIASFVPLGRKSFLSFGLQVSGIQRNIKNSISLSDSSTYTGVTLPPGERVVALNYNYFDVAGGICWSYGRQARRVGDLGQLKACVGLSFYHLGPPHAGFFESRETPQLAYKLHGNLLYAPHRLNLAIVPAFVVQLQGTELQATAGGMIKYYQKLHSKYTGYVKRSSIGLGVYCNNSGGMSLTASLELLEQYTIGLAYDLRSPRISNPTPRAYELLLRYTPPKAFLYQKRGKVQ